MNESTEYTTGGATVPPAIPASIEINSDWIVMYARDGSESYWKRESIASAEAMGLSQSRHDPSEAFDYWNANVDAWVTTVRQVYVELVRKGYIDEEKWPVLSQAAYGAVEAYKELMIAIGGLPSENHIASLAEHKRIHGSIDPRQFPQDSRYSTIVDTFPAERAEYWKNKSEADSLEARANIAAGIAAGLVEAPEGWVSE